MKTVLKPGVPEVAQYDCDVTGLPLRDGPVATITVKCGYGSIYDGHTFELDLSEKAAEVVLPLLRALLLDGAPFEPHLKESCFFDRSLGEKRISRRECAILLRHLEKLRRCRRRTLPIVKRGLVESKAGKTTYRSAFPKHAATTKPKSR